MNRDCDLSLRFRVPNHEMEMRGQDKPTRVFQGRAMSALSRIGVRLGFAGGRAIGCLLGGTVERLEHAA